MRLFEKELDTLKGALEAEHPESLSTMAEFGLAYRSIDEFTRASDIHEFVWDCRSRALGPKHPSTLGSVDFG